MNLVLTVLEVVAPVFALAAIGFAWVRAGFEYRVEFVTRLATTLAVPCLIFMTLVRADITPAALATVSAAALAAYAALGLAFWAGLRATGMEIRTWLAPMVFGNTGNLGLPLALFAFGEAGLSLAVVIFAVTSVLAFTVGVWLVSGGGSPGRVLREPMVPAALLGVVFLSQGWGVPVWVGNTMDLVGQMAIPLMLLTLGVAVARLRPAGFLRPLAMAGVRVAACTAVGWAVGTAIGLSGVALSVLILQVATPAPVTSYLLAEKFGADAEAVAGLVVVSTLLAVLTIPLTLAVLL